MQAFQSLDATSVSKPLFGARARAAQSVPTVQMVVRVATREVEAARRALRRLPEDSFGIHTVEVDRRRDLACLYVEIGRERTGEAMSLLIRALSSAEFGAIRRLER